MIRNKNKEIRIATAKSLKAAKTASQTKDIVFYYKARALDKRSTKMCKCIKRSKLESFFFVKEKGSHALV